METKDTIKVLSDLCQLDVYAVHAYQQAIERIDHTEIQSNLESFKGDHERHIDELSKAILKLGGAGYAKFSVCPVVTPIRLQTTGDSYEDPVGMETGTRGCVALVVAAVLAAGTARADEPAEADDPGIPGEADWASRRDGKDEEPERQSKPAAKPRVVEPEQPRPPRTREEKQRRATSMIRWGGVGLAGAGAVTLGAAAYFGARARSLSRETNQPVDRWTAELDQKVARARSRETTAFVLLGMGGTAVALGGAAFGASFLLFTSPGPGLGAAPAMSVAPGLLPGGAGLVLEGSFW
jgi:hypothetical protein